MHLKAFSKMITVLHIKIINILILLKSESKCYYQSMGEIFVVHKVSIDNTVNFQ